MSDVIARILASDHPTANAIARARDALKILDGESEGAKIIDEYLACAYDLARGRDRSTVTSPVEFYIGGKRYPAGRYVLQRLDDAGSDATSDDPPF